MANFKPLKQYLLILMDEMQKKYGFTDPFLDAGCGIGDVAEHFARMGWEGIAVDLSTEAIAQARVNLQPYQSHVTVIHGDASQVTGSFRTVFMCDILEHLEDDTGFLSSIAQKMTNDAFIIIAVPIRSKEWRWDDEFYGHIRRYEITDLYQLLDNTGFRLLEIWDFTFPVFWMLRRIYTRVLSKQRATGIQCQTQTTASAVQNAWEPQFITAHLEKIFWWKLVFWLQKKMKMYLWGHECILIATRKTTQAA